MSDTISVLKYKIRENTLVASCFKVLFSQRSTGLICIYFIPFVAWWMRSASGCDAKRVDMQHVGGYRAEPGGGGRVSSAWLAPMAAPAPLGAGTSSPHVLLLRHSRLSSAEPCWSHSVTPPAALKAPFVLNKWGISCLKHCSHTVADTTDALYVISVALLLSA